MTTERSRMILEKITVLGQKCVPVPFFPQKSHRDWLWNEQHLQSTMPTANDLSHNMVLVYFTAAKPTVHNPKYI